MRYLFVDDEVSAGFGRTGKMFGVEHYGVVPDVMLLGKGFANGISMAGIIARKEIMEKEAEFPVVRGGSFAGNPVSCVATLATIREVQERDLVANSERVGKYLLSRLRETQEDFELVGDVRGLGMMIGVELVKNRVSKEPAPREVESVCLESFKRGLLVGQVGTYNQVIRITPPLILTEEEGDVAISILEDALKKVSAGSG